MNGQWSGKPATMIRKVALVQALREAFPARLGAIVRRRGARLRGAGGGGFPRDTARGPPWPRTQRLSPRPLRTRRGDAPDGEVPPPVEDDFFAGMEN